MVWALNRIGKCFVVIAAFDHGGFPNSTVIHPTQGLEFPKACRENGRVEDGFVWEWDRKVRINCIEDLISWSLLIVSCKYHS
jgi:hypothetical protein